MASGKLKRIWATAVSDHPLTFLLIVCFAAVLTPAAAQNDYFACASCHGMLGEGSAAKNAPVLAGLDSVYVRRQMSAFRNGVRGSDPDDRFGVEMALIAAAYDEAAVERLAAAIGSFPIRPAGIAGRSAGNVQRGRTLYALCQACHGDNGEGSPAAGAPMLAGQDRDYLVRQLANFRDGRRGAHPQDAAGASMGRVVRAGLTGPDDFDDIAAYVGSLPH